MLIEKTKIILKPDPGKVLLRSFTPATENQRQNILKRILSLSEEDAVKEFEIIKKEFGDRHRNISGLFIRRFKQLSGYLDKSSDLSEVRQMLIGASFSMEYALESTALFNPSIILHPDQSMLFPGSKRFILSLRATGEGHISSIVFREGELNKENKIIIEEQGRFVSPPETIRNIDLESSGYEILYNEEIPLSERIIFSNVPMESNGIEDARFVRFIDDDNSVKYYATYTAYDGMRIQSRLLETKDFLQFNSQKISGPEAHNKGMALFPRKVNGKYAMLSRQDNENNFIMFSDNLYYWDNKKLLSKPLFNWETIQIGNCGSPIETEAGWLVLTHGVGPVRKYCIGAMLLDLQDPTKINGRLKEPLVTADETEREGYVPNVVYTCGSLVNKGELIIPYAMSDYASSFAKVNLKDLLKELKTG